MVKFIDIDSSDPYKEFLNFYELALKSGQDNIEAISVSSYSKEPVSYTHLTLPTIE